MSRLSRFAKIQVNSVFLALGIWIVGACANAEALYSPGIIACENELEMRRDSGLSSMSLQNNDDHLVSECLLLFFKSLAEEIKIGAKGKDLWKLPHFTVPLLSYMSRQNERRHGDPRISKILREKLIVGKMQVVGNEYSLKSTHVDFDVDYIDLKFEFETFRDRSFDIDTEHTHELNIYGATFVNLGEISIKNRQLKLQLIVTRRDWSNQNGR